VLTLPFDVGERMLNGVIEREELGSERARDHLRAALLKRVSEHPQLELVSVDAPSDRARLTERERELDALVDDILRNGYEGRTTVDASFGPVLAEWGQGLEAQGLLVARGLSVLPSEIWDRSSSLGSDGSTSISVGFLQVALLLIDLPTGDVLWMDLYSELLGDEAAVTWMDARDAWVSDKLVGGLLETLPVARDRS